MTSENEAKVRLDKWLWAARLFKTRTLAKEAVEGGKVHYNEQRSKPGKNVELGAMLTVTQGWYEKVIEVVGLSEQRKNATAAQLLYRETDASIEKRERAILARKQLMAATAAPISKPNKRDRRLIHRFKAQNQLE